MGTLLSRHYIRYIIIVVHGKSCARACVPLRPTTSLRDSSHPLLFPPSPPPPPPPSPPPLPLPLPSSSVCPVLSLMRLSFALLRVSFAARSRGSPLSPPPWMLPPPLASCATVNHSACDCVRLITVIRLLLVPVYRPLIIIIDFYSYVTSLFSCRFVRTAPRMYGQTDRPTTDRRESLSFGSSYP